MGRSHSPPGSGNSWGFQGIKGSGNITGGFNLQRCELLLFLLTAEGSDSNGKISACCGAPATSAQVPVKVTLMASH